MLDSSLLSLLRLVSPALPVGAFAYSQGLEGAVEQKWVTNEAQAIEWITSVFKQNIAKLDLPALYWQRIALQQHDEQEFRNFNQTIFAHRETSELRLETHQLGQALLRLLRDTDAAKDEITQTLLNPNTVKNIDWVSAFAIATHCYSINHEQALLGFAWAWSETQVAAAVKLVPLGQTQGQRLLIQLSDEILHVVGELNQQLSTNAKDLSEQKTHKQQIGAVSPNLTIISSRHETQYSRLFRS